MLFEALSGIESYPDPNVLVGYETADDAGVYRLDAQTALVQSVDFFTPVVDDPYLYGQIAAANALSDIYAMGAVPRFALSVLGFPKEPGQEKLLREILRGGTDKMSEARVPVLGGHSVQDPEIKFGYCVTGFVHPDRIYTNRRARPGDALLLTKPVGSGIIATGIKFGKADPRVIEEAVAWMLTLNASAAQMLEDFPVHAVTDITGYGVLGHAYEMAAASRVTLTIQSDKVPLLAGAEQLASKGMLPGGIETNRRYVGEALRWHPDVSKLRRQVLLDPQTSGGLLISLPEDAAPALAERLRQAGLAGQWIGRASEPGPYLLEVH